MPARLRQRRARATALGLLAGTVLDQIAGDPRRGHPVALFGAAAGTLEARMWRDDRAAGARYAALLITAPAVLGVLPRNLPAAWLAAVTAVGTWAVLGSRSLSAEADAVAAYLRRGDLPAARRQLTHLVGRRTHFLDEAEIARATIESVAENTSDAVVAPLLWGAVAGLPGLLAYRAVNTLDAMVGHHSPHYENFGWASARADDIANYVPARLTAALTAAIAPAVGGSWRAALAVARQDGRRHPSPNAGVPEASFAGALGVRLGGRNDYGSHVEDRPVLGRDGRAPTVDDITRAARLSRAVTAAAAVACAAIAAAGMKSGLSRTDPADSAPHAFSRVRASAGQQPCRPPRTQSPQMDNLGPVKGALLVAGTSSDAGKSVLVAGLCRWLARQGVRVAPFKAQNMALNSAVTADGAEIGRAQAMQAAAACVEPEAAMNPVLLKPGSETRSQVVLLGRPVAEAGALDYQELKPVLQEAVAESLADLRRRFDVVICEGAGSPAEINLRDRDIANMGLARAADLPVIVVGDIDRGGLLAAMYGTLAVLDPADQRHIAAFVVNKFRGDLRLLAPGLDMLKSLTGRPTLGVLPWSKDLWLDAEDSLDLDSRPRLMLPPAGAQTLRVAVVRLPRMSNVTDVDALAAEPGVAVDLASTPAELHGADLVILPGTRATVSDLGWLRDTGIAAAITERAERGLPVLGICGGYQMLARTIDDHVESRAGMVPGLGLLPARVRFVASKTLARPSGFALGEPVQGYEIHHGVVTTDGGETFLDGCESGAVRGTAWHGIFENDGFRRAFLTDLAARTGRDFTPAPDVSFAAVRERRYDMLADMIGRHLDTAAILSLVTGGVPAGLPTVVSGLAVP